MRTLIAMLLLVASLLAQTPIVVANLAPVPRSRGWVTVVVPNEAVPKPPLTVQGRNGWLAFLGETWGPTARLVHVRYQALEPHEHAQVQLASRGPDPAEEPILTPSTAPVAASVPTLVVRVGAATSRLAMVPQDVPESITRTVMHGKGRVPGTMLVAHWWYGVYPASRMVTLELVVANSDPSTPSFVQALDGLWLETPAGVYPVLDYHTRRGGKPPVPAGRGTMTALVDWPTWLGDGQAFAFRGRLLLHAGATAEDLDELLPDLQGPVVAQALPAAWKGRWGPWGELPALHPSEDTIARGFGQRGVLELWQRHASKTGRPDEHPSGPIFAEPDWGNGWRPPQAGDHEDFGVTAMAPCLSPPLGGPSHLHDVGHAVLYEWLRPSHKYTALGDPEDPLAHPECWWWGWHVHWHPHVSPDRMGKPNVGEDPTNAVEFSDLAHVSSNSVVGWCLLTPSHLGRQLVQQIEMGWMLQSYVSKGLSEPRGWGRSMQLMVQCNLVSGNAAVRQRLRERFDKSFEDYLARKDKPMAPFGIYGPDARQLDGKTPFSMSWQCHLALTGIDAAYQLCYVQHNEGDLGKAKARDVLISLSRSLLENSWWVSEGRWSLTYALRWDDGRALPPEAYDDPNQVTRDWPGTDVAMNSSGSLVVARRWLTEMGRADLVQKVDAILSQQDDWFVHGQTEPQGFTRYSTWRATR